MAISFSPWMLGREAPATVHWKNVSWASFHQDEWESARWTERMRVLEAHGPRGNRSHATCKGMWQLGDKSTVSHPLQRKGDNIKRWELRDTQIPDHRGDFKHAASELLPRGKVEPMKDCKQRNGDQIFLFGKVILARAKKGMIGAETEGVKKKRKR